MKLSYKQNSFFEIEKGSTGRSYSYQNKLPQFFSIAIGEMTKK